MKKVTLRRSGRTAQKDLKVGNLCWSLEEHLRSVNLVSDFILYILDKSAQMQMQVIQIASFLGFSPIITTASLHNTDLLKGFGATHVVDRRSDVASSIKEIMQSTPLTMIYDAVHTPISQAEVDLLSSGGKLLTMWHFP